jgi:hypothetical protein
MSIGLYYSENCSTSYEPLDIFARHQAIEAPPQNVASARIGILTETHETVSNYSHKTVSRRVLKAKTFSPISGLPKPERGRKNV